MSYRDDGREQQTGHKRQRDEEIIDAKQALISLIFKAGDIAQVRLALQASYCLLSPSLTFAACYRARANPALTPSLRLWRCAWAGRLAC